MHKDTVEFHRIDDCIRGYGSLYDYSDADVMNAIMEWSRGKPAVKVYRHVVRTEFRPYADGRYRESKGWTSGAVKTSDEYTFGYMVWLLDIYWQ